MASCPPSAVTIPLTPLAKNRHKPPGVEEAKHALDGVVRRYSVLQCQETSQPVFFQPTPQGDILEVVGIREHGANRDHRNFLEIMQGSVARSARIVESGKGVYQIRPRDRRHFFRPKDESRPELTAVYKTYA